LEWLESGAAEMFRQEWGAAAEWEGFELFLDCGGVSFS
jgi:hypothetical protein